MHIKDGGIFINNLESWSHWTHQDADLGAAELQVEAEGLLRHRRVHPQLTSLLQIGLVHRFPGFNGQVLKHKEKEY